jgi:ketosteroid isomerase-like protein
MSEQENIQKLKLAFAAFARGDIPTVLADVSENIDFQHPVPREIWPWAGKRRGKAELLQFFAGLADITEFEKV